MEEINFCVHLYDKNDINENDFLETIIKTTLKNDILKFYNIKNTKNEINKEKLELNNEEKLIICKNCWKK
jgi:hypothetical protein